MSTIAESSSIEPSGPDADPFVQAYPEHTEFWQAAERGVLLLKTCRACGRVHWIPRAICPLCHSTEVEWREASGKATLYAFSSMQRVEPAYTVAYVRLDEGPTLLTNIEGVGHDGWRIDQPLSVRFQRAPQGRSYPIFVPA
jgi:hypothetical protein